ncbi:protein PET100 homolog, mitochondrial isoform X1 [Micropterus salmoides]|uniref:protein PET100 homolog, mitochondrial isoform X1 n=2 Tax=Micropterus TaxID=27705 RepID=UPI0018ECE420|nr:protein PET100 homolog, mitochondrial isoform X1 [Micropterus salmoides]
MTAGERPSSRNQDPDVRPQGKTLHYSLGFVMTVSAMHGRTESMMLYLSFPVTMFWISNQAEYFEEYIVKRKREIFPPDEGMHRKELEDFKERMRVRKERRILKDISLESEN